MKKRIRFTSLVTLLTFLLVLALPQNMYAASTVTLDWDTNYQNIDGFGVSEAFHQSNNIALLGDTKKNEIYDLLFSTTKGAGFSIFRSILGDGGTWGNAEDGPNKTMQPSETTWDWKESNDDQIPMYKEIREKYGIDKLLYTAWSPPAWMKSNGSTSRGTIKADKYQAYATYLAEHIKNYKSKFGIDITHIGISNEPNLETNYSSCTWSSSQFKTFMKDYLVPTFDKENITAKVIMGEPMACTESFAIDSLNDATASKRTDIVGCHNYGSTYVAFPTTKSKGKGIWMTEVSDMNGNDITINDGLKWAKEVHDFMTITQGNSWSYWWGACYKTHNGEGLIQMNMGAKTYTVAKRLYTIGQYARFIRPEWQRFSATASPVSGVYVTAYKDPATGEFAVVAINNGSSDQSVSFNLKGFTASAVTPYTTSASQNLAEGSSIAVSGSSFTGNLPAKSVTTFVGAKPTKKVSGYISSSSSDLKEGFKVEAEGTSTLTDDKGYFELTNIPENTTETTVKISKDGYLAREIKNVKVSGTLGTNGNPVEIWAGDTTQDGAINMADVLQIAKFFNSTSGSTKYNAEADLSNDGVVNMADVLIVAKHFNATIDSYPAL
ncbi:glycoside hydrolase [Pseudobacteroides cellulosolvens]|uniref:Glucuronoarabinoxylan endo-1,4-beta-xylanase n=1 Tax=Pseudobacteroides cellulosolvens ATCC 35603 = DSM 2933 TaxID=398512 RepID=A0A0L6JSW0_9FIRM|nr:glycoside hydrolase [Pseudobacteroides cellulosolvens]KNY28903.1 Glucuronoarabinoxylan endo-1,4-beta-xylanase [Pseudobacteroides cellulosolvens ATCC 35603 = DSM 2933]